MSILLRACFFRTEPDFFPTAVIFLRPEEFWLRTEHRECRSDVPVGLLTLWTAGICASGACTNHLVPQHRHPRKAARLHVVKGGPHCVTWTHADEVNAVLLGFLGEKVANPKREVA